VGSVSECPVCSTTNDPRTPDAARGDEPAHVVWVARVEGIGARSSDDGDVSIADIGRSSPTTQLTDRTTNIVERSHDAVVQSAG